jgi:ABC-type dipeptide/oligopeptide/nickel transport system permease component
MLRFALRETARLVSSLLGAALLTTALACLDTAAAWHGLGGFSASFASHAQSFARLDLGTSVVTGRDAWAELAGRLPATLLLISGGMLIALAVGGPLGLLLGGGPGRRAAAPLIQIIAAAPVFCGALLLAFIAQKFLHWPIATGGASLFAESPYHLDLADPIGSLKPLLLPILTVGAAGAACVQLALRRSSAEVAHEPYRRGLRLLGLPALEIERVYVVPQVAAALVASLGEIVLAMLAASAVAEWVFDIPGAAVLFVKSVALGDWSIASLVLFVFAAIALAADFIGTIAWRALADNGVAQ